MTLLLALALAGCSGAAPSPQVITITAPPAVTVTVTETLPPTPETHAISGKLRLSTRSLGDGPGATCWGIGGYDDLKVGAQVVVTDEAKKVIANSAIAKSLVHRGIDPYCDLSFVVENVPTAAFYSVEVSRRGALTFSHAELAAAGWQVEFSLGDGT